MHSLRCNNYVAAHSAQANCMGSACELSCCTTARGIRLLVPTWNVKLPLSVNCSSGSSTQLPGMSGWSGIPRSTKSPENVTGPLIRNIAVPCTSARVRSTRYVQGSTHSTPYGTQLRRIRMYALSGNMSSTSLPWRQLGAHNCSTGSKPRVGRRQHAQVVDSPASLKSPAQLASLRRCCSHAPPAVSEASHAPVPEQHAHSN